MASAMRQLVGEVEDARAKRLRVNEPKKLLIAPMLKEALSAAHDNRVDHEPKLVADLLGKQRPDESAAAGDRDVLTRLVFEPGDLLREVVTLDQSRVLPLERLLKGSRDYVLGGVVHIVGKLLVVTTLVRPESGELFVGHPSEEHGVGISHRRADRLTHFVVEVWQVPLFRRFHHAIQR